MASATLSRSLCLASALDKPSKKYFLAFLSSHRCPNLLLMQPAFSTSSGAKLRRYNRRICLASSSFENGRHPRQEEEKHASRNSGNFSIDNSWSVLRKANTFLPHVILASTLLAFVSPVCFTWFTNRYYAPALGFLMFAVGINFDMSDFIHSFQRPWVIIMGYMGQFVLKPLLGIIFASLAVSKLHLPEAIGTGMILVACVSGAQLSNYATFLVEPTMAPLSIVMTSLSTATAVFVTPSLTLLLLGKRLPIDFYGMIVNITQIVVVPIAAGIVINKFVAGISRSIRPFMPLFSVLVTSLCIGSPLAMNVTALKSPFGLSVLLLVVGFHATAFLLGFYLPSLISQKSSDQRKIQRTISFETGMQSSLLGLALANKFFTDSQVALPPAISTVVMSLMGFSLVLYWNMEDKFP